AIERGLLKGIERAGKLYEQRKYFIPELLICSEATYAGLEVLSSHIRSEKLTNSPKIVLGVAKGDIHQIGKDLVKIMLEASGWEVIDLGCDVSQEHFLSKVLETGAKVAALSASMSTSLIHMKTTIEMLKKGTQQAIRVMVGGGIVTESFAKTIGADAYGRSAFEAPRIAVSLLHRG
ncbi:MAG: cobalamin-dependent protein, partial [Candidatus Bathyarchaeia archaeon]